MSVRDTRNKNFMLPDMSDYYYDAPDQQTFYADIDKALNPVRRKDSAAGTNAMFYLENPPESGYHEDTNTYVIDVAVNGDNSSNPQAIKGIVVHDGDTAAVMVNSLKPKDEKTTEFVDKIKKESDDMSYSSSGEKASDYAKISFRFACMDAMELPHFEAAGSAENYESFDTESIDPSTKVDDPNYVVSIYQSFMENPEKATGTENVSFNGDFYRYDRRIEKANVVKLPDGKYHQYFDRDGKRYILYKVDTNSYEPERIADAGIARDTVVNALKNASEIKVMMDANSMARTKNKIVSMFHSDPYDRTSFSTFLDSCFDYVTEYDNAGFNYYGLDAYGRAVAAIYVKLGDDWVNLNKLVIANTDYTVPNKYASLGAQSRNFDEASYEYDRKKYVDDIYNMSKELFDDRDQVQRKIFGQSFDALKEWTVTLGDVTLFVPPTSIRCLTQTKAERMPIARAKGAVAKSATKMQRIVEIDVYFNEDRGINGYPYKMETRPGSKKEITYWMNGLRALYAEFRVAPFLPVDNNYINQVLNIDAVTMLNFSANTVPNFPRLIKATIQLAEFEYRVYMPEIAKDDMTMEGRRNHFSEQINYPLLRYYYQRLLRNGEELKNEDFLGDKYIHSTFGNKTCLIPSPCQSSGIKFYIPNQESLDKVLSTKIERLKRAATIQDLSKNELNFAKDIAKVDNELEWLGTEQETDPLLKVNSYLRSCDDNLFLMEKDGMPVIKKGTTNSEGLYVFEKQDDKTKEFQKLLSLAADDYENALCAIKNKDNQQLCMSVKEERTGEEIKGTGMATAALTYNAKVKVNAPYISEDERNSLRTLATTQNPELSSSEIFKDGILTIPFTVNLSNISSQLNTIDRAKGDNIYAIQLGPNAGSLFHIENKGDVGFIKFLTQAADHLTGNEETNAVKASIDYVTERSIIFEPYAQEQEFHAESIQIGVSNTFSQITLQNTPNYAPQYMGGTDIKISLSLYTTSKEAAAALNNLPAIAADFTRHYRLVLTAWPLKIESEFTKLFGITDAMIETVEVSTVPNMPGLYHVNMMLISMDRTLRNREALKKNDLKNFHNLSVEGVYAERNWRYNEMSQYLSETELYPDLELPTLDELDKNGFAFIRYSNKQRKYPDPDFYFTYSYVLVSQIIREAVLNSLQTDIAQVSLTDSTGKSMKGHLLNSMGSWEKNFELDEGWDRTIQEAFTDDESYLTAKILSDFQILDDERRDETWGITPEVKVAFCEKRILNHLNDKTKQKFKEEKGGQSSKDNTSDTESSASDDNTNAEAPTNSNNSNDTGISSDNKIYNKAKAVENMICEKIDNILGQPVGDDIEHAGYVFGVFSPSVNSTPAPQGATTYETDSSAEQYNDALSTDNINKWLEAAAAAICSNDGVSYSASVFGKITNTIDKGHQGWEYRKAFRGYVKKATGEERYIDQPMSVLESQRTQGIVSYESAIKSIDTIDGNAVVEEIVESAIRFGFFDFRFYTASELESRFGYYGNTTKESSDGKRILAPRRNGYRLYLADPYYRFADEDTIKEYVRKCTTDFNFAKNAFFRICLLYFKCLVSYDILPSFSYDIFREELNNVNRMKAVAVRMKELKDGKTKEATAKSEASKQGTYKYSKKTKAPVDVNALPQQALVNTSDETSDIERQTDALYKEFKHNVGPIDTGKLFLCLCMGIVDGNKSFYKVLIDRDLDALNAISMNALTGASMEPCKGEFYAETISTFIKAAGGTEAIDREKINAASGEPLGSSLIKANARLNAAAASDDPSMYLVHSFYDMVVHDCRGRMLRAFPTFYMILIDEGRKIGRWKLHDNFYNINSISSITIAKSRKIPTDTAEIVMSNYFNTFTTEDEDLNRSYTANFTDVFRSLWLPTLQEYAVDEERHRTNALSPERFRLKAGARVHLRVGYGSDASHLPIAFNGMIAELETGSIITLVCQSDGAELAKPIMFDIYANELANIDNSRFKDIGSNGDTPKNILRYLMNCYGGIINEWMHKNNKDEIAEMLNMGVNPLGIYHFGNPDEPFKICGDNETMQNIFEVGVQNSNDRYSNTEPTDDVPIINFEVFGKTVWDIAHICKSVDPSYYVAVLPFNMRSTLFFGRAKDYYAYDYENIGGTWCEKRRPFQQYHIYSSETDIINNGIAVSSKDIKTCAVGMYEVSGFMNDKVSKKTDPQWFDAAVFPEYQRTMYVDTKLYGMASRKLGVASDAVNWVIGGITNSLFDRASDETGDVRNHNDTAVKMTINALKSQMKEMYQGQISIIGDPSVKPQDRITISDSFNGITGQTLVRDVVQIFSAEQGYKTVLTPDLIVTTLGDEAAEEIKTNGMASTAVNFAVSSYATMKALAKIQEGISKAKGFVNDLKSTPEAAKALQQLSETATSAGKSISKVTGAASTLAKNAVTVLKNGSKIASIAGNVASVAGTIGAGIVGSVGAALATTALPAILGTLAVGYVVTSAIGTMSDIIASQITSRKRLVLFPLMKYGRPMVGGIDGHVGSVYGAPNFNSQDAFQKVLSKIPGVETFAGAVSGISEVFSAVHEGQIANMQKISAEEGLSQEAMQAVANSQLEFFTKAPFNPARPRIKELNKSVNVQQAQALYGVKAKTPQDILQDPHMSKMSLVYANKRLKYYIDLGLFRIAAFEKGFTPDISDAVKCIYLPNPERPEEMTPVNSIHKEDDGTYDIPYLHNDALGVLVAIVEKYVDYLVGTEQQRDVTKWCKDNDGCFLTLVSSLICGSEKGYENTGFSFILSASDDKSMEAVTAAINGLEKQMVESHAKKASIPDYLTHAEIKGNNINVIVHPPEDDC